MNNIIFFVVASFMRPKTLDKPHKAGQSALGLTEQATTIPVLSDLIF